MAACIPITREKIRAEVYMGTTLIAKTPFIQSFNVSKSRNQPTNTCSVSMEIMAGTSFPLGERLIVKAGTRGNLKTIFTGILEGTQSQPSFGKPSYFNISLTARGVLSQLDNKTFSRRLKSDGQGLFCLITGGSVNRPSAYTSLDVVVKSGNKQVFSNSPNPAQTGNGEHSSLVRYNDTAVAQATGGYVKELAGRPSGGAANNSGGAGLGVHDHSDVDNGGPAFAVYSAD